MRIREDWYKEDQQAKRTEADALEDQMKREAKASGFYGNLKIGE